MRLMRTLQIGLASCELHEQRGQHFALARRKTRATILSITFFLLRVSFFFLAREV